MRLILLLLLLFIVYRIEISILAIGNEVTAL